MTLPGWNQLGWWRLRRQLNDLQLLVLDVDGVLTDGGLGVNEDLALLGHGDLAIPGLWTAGSAGQGGLILKGHGHHIGWAFTSGRIAGRNAAAAARGKA